MSTGLECNFYEIERGRWIYALARDKEDCWDWREDANVYGPFVGLGAAEKHLQDNHSNPGGFRTIALPEGQDKIDVSGDDTIAAMIRRAEAPRRTQYARPYFR